VEVFNTVEAAFDMISQLESARRHRTLDEQIEPYVWYQDYFFAGIFLFFCLCVKNREEADKIRKLSGYIPLFTGFTIWHSQITQPFNVLQVKLTIIALQYLMPELIGDVLTSLINWSYIAWNWMKPHLWNWMKPHLDDALQRAGLLMNTESLADEGVRGRSETPRIGDRFNSPQPRIAYAVHQPPAQEPAVPAQEHVVPAQQSAAIPQQSAAIPQKSAAIPQEPAAIPQEPAEIPQEPAAIPQEPAAIPQEPAEIPQEPAAIPQEPAEIPQEPAAPVTSNRKPKRTHDPEEPRRSVRRKR
jgi:hypothetical protein